MKRRGILEPWRAGLTNLRVMLTYGVNVFLFKPGLVLLTLGFLSLAALSFGPLSIASEAFSLNAMLLAAVIATLGLSMVFSGLIASVLFDYSDTLRGRIESTLPFARAIVGCLLAALLGVLLMVPLVRSWAAHHFVLQQEGIEAHRAVVGLWLVAAAFQTFIFAAMIRALGAMLPKRARTAPCRPSRGRRDIANAAILDQS